MKETRPIMCSQVQVVWFPSMLTFANSLLLCFRDAARMVCFPAVPQRQAPKMWEYLFLNHNEGEMLEGTSTKVIGSVLYNSSSEPKAAIHGRTTRYYFLLLIRLALYKHRSFMYLVWWYFLFAMPFACFDQSTLKCILNIKRYTSQRE